VTELGIVLWLLTGWQFAAAEFTGGALMIALVALVLPWVIPAAAHPAALAPWPADMTRTPGTANRGWPGARIMAQQDRVTGRLVRRRKWRSGPIQAGV